jgi:hypothetical protein
MTLEEKLTELLRAICPRVFRGTADLNTPKPYITYQRLGGQSLAFMDNAIPSQRNALVQVNVWATSPIEADALIQQVEVALRGATGMQATPEAESRDASEPDMNLAGASQDFSIWADR